MVASEFPAAGVVCVDKPEGPTSFDVVSLLRKSLKVRAVGHAGTLDPAASGLLVVLVGGYTRFSQYLTSASKTYLATVVFGVSTTTDDREGDVLSVVDPSGLSLDDVQSTIRLMHGEQEQIPPIYSAISVAGERLYKKARRGEVFEPAPRTVVISRIEIVEPSLPSLQLLITCSKGTYVRSIARDLGTKLGVPAHLGALRRVDSGGYRIQDAWTLDALADPQTARRALLRGPGALRGLPTVSVTDEEAKALEQGRGIPTSTGAPASGVAVAHCADSLIALMERQDDRWRVLRGLGRC